MKYISINENDFNNGDGVVVSLWTAGCPHNCKGCHNPETHDRNAGMVFDKPALEQILTSLNDKYVSGLSILGGEPLTDYNYPTVLHLARFIKERYPEKKINIWTGYTLQELINQDKQEIMFYLDMLVDGRFVEELKGEFKYCGSSNQKVRTRVI